MESLLRAYAFATCGQKATARETSQRYPPLLVETDGCRHSFNVNALDAPHRFPPNGVQQETRSPEGKEIAIGRFDRVDKPGAAHLGATLLGLANC